MQGLNWDAVAVGIRESWDNKDTVVKDSVDALFADVNFAESREAIEHEVRTLLEKTSSSVSFVNSLIELSKKLRCG